MGKKILYICFRLSLLFMAGCCCPHKFLPLADPPAPLPFCLPKKVRVALVLGSGGVRGIAHAGVLKVLEENEISIDVIVGCSAGSLVGALYADTLNADLVKSAVSKMKTNSLLDLDLWDCRFGLCQGRSMRKILNNTLEAKNFDQLKIPLVVVATDLHTGELVPIGNGDLVKAVEASCAIPLVFCPVEYQGRILVDGGTINPVPVMVAKDLDADIIIAVDLCELLPKTFPTNLFGVAARSAEIAFLWQNEVCTQNADIIIRPSMCDIGTFNDKAGEILYSAGRNAALKVLPRIKKIIASRLSQEELELVNPDTRLITLNCYNADYFSYPHKINEKVQSCKDGQ